MHLAVLYFRRKRILLNVEVLFNDLTRLQRMDKIKATKFAELVFSVGSFVQSNREHAYISMDVSLLV